jgi:hypothetical protein
MLLPILYLPLRSWAPRRHVALLLAAIICGLCLVWMMVDRPRYALAGPAATNAFLWSIVLASSLRLAISKVSHRLPVVPSRRLLNTFVLIFFVLFGLRYMGRLYPSSMLGDIGFHINRQHNVIQGTILLLSRHRAIDFPYPSAVYVLLLPLRLLPIEASSLVNWSDALFGALGLFPLGYLMLYAWRSELAATFAALVYALLAPAMMSLWWSFLPHIFAQELAVLLLVGLIVGWQRLGTGRGWAIGSLGLSILFLSHFGFYINISVLFGFFLLLVFALRKRAWASRAFAVNIRSVMLIFATAQIIAFGLFYSAFLGLFTDKLLVFSRGGMSAVQGGRGTTPASVLWNLIWTNGLGVHYATIGVPIAALGAYLLLCGPADPILKMIFIATGVTTLVQGAIPFLTASTITTRWLSFATWIVAVGVAVFLEALWRRGPIGRLAGVLCLSWLLFNTLRIWANATGYRITPPEPF